MSQLLDLTAIRTRRRLPIGAEPLTDGHVHFRVWAPSARRVDVVFAGGQSHQLTPDPGGYFEGLARGKAGDRYQFRLDSSDFPYPDPASRFQPEGPHHASAVVDPAAFEWTDAAWKGVTLEGQILYELHTGTFTREGTWAAAAEQLLELADAGITVVELMPVAEFEGRFGWGYDGVDLFAPSHLYGEPDDLRRFIDRAHAAGIGVILDVVYNHLGPSGNYLRAFSPRYFTDRYQNEWGDAINFDGEDAGPVREFFIANATYWIDEFHFDGLRLDATQQIFDRSCENVMAAITARVHDARRGRSTIVIAENEPQDTRLVRPVGEGGYGLDGLWNDDLHHSALVALTGRAEAYYSDTRGTPQEFISAAKYGSLFQGQYYHWQHKTGGTPALDLPPARFVNYLQNHDQVANSARGLRAHQLTSPAKWRAMTALVLLLPGTPMLFQGQEFSASAPFLYFADFDQELAAAVRRGRADFLKQFTSVVRFQECQVDGAALSTCALALRFFTEGGADDRVLVVNLGADLRRDSFAEPLLAPPWDCDWRVVWSSEDPRYGGLGLTDIGPQGRWYIRGESAVVVAPTARPPAASRSISRRTA